MQEEIKKQTMEESAPVTEIMEQQDDISKKYTKTEMAQMRQRYMKSKKEEIEVLKVDVEFMGLQVEHYELSKQIAKINAEIQAVKEHKTEQFASKLAI